MLKKGRLIAAPGVYDMVSLRIADRMGFESLYMTGYGGLLNVAHTVAGYEAAGAAGSSGRWASRSRSIRRRASCRRATRWNRPTVG